VFLVEDLALVRSKNPFTILLIGLYDLFPIKQTYYLHLWFIKQSIFWQFVLAF